MLTGFVLVPLVPFNKNQNKESNFQQVCVLVIKNFSTHYLHRVALCFEGINLFNKFLKMKFLHVVPVIATASCWL